MAQFEIIVGTVLGASEYVADALHETLLAQGHQANIHLTPQFADIPQHAIWIICTSTHGAGDFPDNIQPFAKHLTTANLTGLRYLIVGLGDSSYDTFCYGAINMETLLNKAGADNLYTPHHIDVLSHPIPEDSAVEWLTQCLKDIKF